MRRRYLYIFSELQWLTNSLQVTELKAKQAELQSLRLRSEQLERLEMEQFNNWDGSSKSGPSNTLVRTYFSLVI